jgi:protein-tyrosine-phosphatase
MSIQPPAVPVHILFICTANIIRSPLAAALLRQKFSLSNPVIPWTVNSAGIYEMNSQPAHPLVCMVASDSGLDLSQHTSKQVTLDLVQSSYLVLTMESNHKEALRAAFPAETPKIFLLTEMINRKYDIPDPIGGTLDDFRFTLVQLDRIITQGMPAIIDHVHARIQAG